MIVRCLSHAFIAPLFKATQVNSKKWVSCLLVSRCVWLLVS